MIIQLGTNDAKAFIWDRKKYIRDYTEMVELFVNLPSRPKVYISIPPPLYRNGSAIRMDIVNDVLPEIIPKISEATDTHLINVYDALGGKNFEKPSDYFTPGKPNKWHSGNDGIHPNDLGYIHIASAIAAQLKEPYNNKNLNR